MVQFIVRSGGFRRFAETNGSPIVLDQPTDISLNLSSQQIASMNRMGDNLVIQLINGEKVILQDFFVTFVGGAQNRLFLSHNGDIQEITFEETFGRMNTAEFQGVSGNGDLMFDGGANLGVQTTAQVVEAPVQTGGFFVGGNSLALIGGGLLVAGIAAAGGGGGSTPDTTPPTEPVITTNTSEGISGTGEPGATVTVDVDGDGVADYTTVIGSDGTFTIVYDPALPDGTTVTITITDTSGNPSTPVTVNVDGIAPAAPVVVNAELDQISGTAEAGSTVSIDTTGDGAANYTVVVGSDGTWSIPFSPPLTEGTTITLTATDAAGNVSPTTTFIVDTIDPAVAVINTVNGSGVTGTAEPGSTVSVSIDGGDPINVTVGSDGTFSVTFSPEVGDGVPIVVVVTDPSGNESNPVSVNVDATAPTTPATTFVAPDSANGTGAEPGATVLIDITGDGVPDGSVVVGSDGTWSVDFSTFDPAPSGDLPDGTSVTIQLVDVNGNTNTGTEFFVDGTPPSGSIVSNTPDTLTITINEGATVTVLVNGVASSVTQSYSTSGTYTMSIPSGTYVHGDSITIQSTDGAGNASISTAYTVDLSTIDPTIMVSNGAQISGVAEANATVTVTINGTGYNVTADGSGNWLLTETAAGITFNDGQSFTVSATDTSSNVSNPVSGQVSTAPVVTSVGGASGVDIAGVIAPNTDVQAVFVDGAPGGTGPGLVINVPNSVTSDSNGNWSVDTNPDLPSGEEIFVALDTGGATDSLNYTLVIQGNEGVIDLATALDAANEQGSDINYGIQNLDISAIDISDNTANGLILTSASVAAISDNTDALRIDGVAGNTVDVGTATDTGQDVVINGQTYDVYDFGGGVTAVIDQDITIV